MDATKNISKALYAAYLMAAPGGAGLAYVFRADMASGEQYFFATTYAPEVIGHEDVKSRLPRRRREEGISFLSCVSSVAGR